MNSTLIRIDGRPIAEADSVKYLGLTLNSKFTFGEHIDIVVKRARATTAIFQHAFKKGFLSSGIKRVIYTTIQRPMIGYAFPCWSAVNSFQMERVRTLERSLLRNVVDNRGRMPNSYMFINNRTLYERAQIMRIDKYLVASALKFLQKAAVMDNQIVASKFDPPTGEGYAEMIGERCQTPFNLLYKAQANDLYDVEGNLVTYHRRTRGSGGSVYNINQDRFRAEPKSNGMIRDWSSRALSQKKIKEINWSGLWLHNGWERALHGF